MISALGGSYVQIGGPTGAFVVVVSGIIAEHGLDGLFMCTMMAGVVLVVMGLTGTGTAVRFIPRPVVIGFTNGIALVIASTQLRDVFGIALDGPAPGDFIGRIGVLIENIGSASLPTTAVGIGVLVLIVVWNRLVPRVPGYIVALLAGTMVVAAAQLPLETIGTRFGGIPAGLPDIQIPRFRPDLILSLLSPTLTVAMLGAIESLLSAVVADRMSGHRHNSNVELFAQGVANIVSPMVGGLPATGAIARTATNVRSGGRTPVAGMIHACTLLVILLFASRLAALVPMAVLAAILLVVAYNMGEWREIPELWKHGWTDRIVWLWTFALDGARGSDGRRRGRHDHRGVDVHPTRHGDDDRVTRHAGLRQAWTGAHPAGQGDSRLRHHPADSRTIPVWGHRQAGYAGCPGRGLRTDRRTAPSQHDGARRNRAACNSGFCRCAPCRRAGRCSSVVPCRSRRR